MKLLNGHPEPDHVVVSASRVHHAMMDSLFCETKSLVKSDGTFIVTINPYSYLLVSQFFKEVF